VTLTPYAKAIERAAVLAQQLDAILQNMRQSGELQAFNVCYRAHRAKTNGHCARRPATRARLGADVLRRDLRSLHGSLNVRFASKALNCCVAAK
jgi:hypothetical protein